MSKRILCFLLTLIMLSSVALTGCSNKTDDEIKNEISDEASESTITLSMYLMSEGEVSDDKVEELEAAVNKITKSKFKTKIELRYFTEEEYNDALDKAFLDTEDAREAKKKAEAALKEAIKKGEATTATSTEATEEETVVNEYGVTELKYPPIEDYQVDIFYLGGYDKFAEYFTKGWLSRVDEELASSSKLLNDYMTPQFLTYMKEMKGGTYAIPNNTVLGEYTFMLLNKDALAKWNYSVSASFTTLTCDSVQDLLDKVSRFQSDEFVPLKSFTGGLDISHVKYFGLDENGNRIDSFSVMGGTYASNFKYKNQNEYYPCLNIFADSGFRSQMQTLTSYKENGYYGTEVDATKPFAVGYIKGNYMDIESYLEDYKVVVVEKPVINTADLFANMFAVGGYTSSVSRSMEIITYLNTNVDFRNLILYGIEGVDYDVVEKEVNGKTYQTVKRNGDDYMMSLETTGNTLIAYPLESERADIRDFQIKQNQDIITALDMAFSLDYVNSPVNQNAMNEVRKLSEKIYAELLTIDTVEEWLVYLNGKEAEDTDNDGTPDTEAVEGIYKTITNNEYAKIMRNADYAEDHKDYNAEKYGEGVSFYYIYFKWLSDMKIYVAEFG
ncbi:MAG: hypothetical protein J6A83_04330 [Clostridia bacterium]|nr:hypothetical protein [Clostridia bacterium]